MTAPKTPKTVWLVWWPEEDGGQWYVCTDRAEALETKRLAGVGAVIRRRELVRHRALGT